MSANRVLTRIEPVRLRAEVVHGFGRGSKQLGFPTANMKIVWNLSDMSSLSEDERAILSFVQNFDTGIYCGFACIEDGPDTEVHKVAMSMGWNPTFADVKAKTIEPWILHKFSRDFYGCNLRLLVLGYVRPEVHFGSLHELIKEISADGEFCESALDTPELAQFRLDPFLNIGSVSERQHARSLKIPANVMVGWKLRAAFAKLASPRPSCIRLLLVRHGESVANEQDILSGGGSDCGLSARGCEQAEMLGRELLSVPHLKIDLVGSSALRRAIDSADIIARRFPAVQRAVVTNLREMDYGNLESSRIEDVRGQIAEVARRWAAGDVGHRVGGETGESPDQVAKRVSLAVGELLQEHKDCRVILMVCHSWVAKAFVASLLPSVGLQGLLAVPQRNCAVNIIDCYLQGDVQHYEVLGVDLESSPYVAHL